MLILTLMRAGAQVDARGAVVATRSVAEFFDALAFGVYDCAVIDLDRSDVDAMAIIRKIQQLQPALRVLAAFDPPGPGFFKVRRLFCAGYYDLVSLPLRLEDLPRAA